MINFKKQISLIDINHSCISLNPSYEIRCNKIKNSSIGIRIEANSTVDDLGDSQNPSANKWVNITANEIINNGILGISYYKASNENLPPQGAIFILNTSKTIKQQCQ